MMSQWCSIGWVGKLLNQSITLMLSSSMNTVQSHESMHMPEGIQGSNFCGLQILPPEAKMRKQWSANTFCKPLTAAIIMKNVHFVQTGVAEK